MLSILIPIYNFDITQLVKDLHEQAKSLEKSFEIILIDDASDETYTKINKQPAAPILRKITIKNPQVPKKTDDQEALIDSGAFKTVIPEILIEELQLVPAREIEVEGYKEGKQKHWTYFVDVEFKGYSFPYTEVLAVKRKNVLLGRDILNQTILVLNGKKLSYDITDP